MLSTRTNEHFVLAGWAYAIPFAFIDIPMYVGEVTVWSVIIYFAVGFEYTAGRCASPMWPLYLHSTS